PLRCAWAVVATSAGPGELGAGSGTGAAVGVSMVRRRSCPIGGRMSGTHGPRWKTLHTVGPTIGAQGWRSKTLQALAGRARHKKPMAPAAPATVTQAMRN